MGTDSKNTETEQYNIPSVRHSFKVGDVVDIDVYGFGCPLHKLA